MPFQCIPAWLSTGFIDVPSLSSMEPSSRCSVWAGHRHRGHLEGTGGGSSERGEDSYLAAREDIELATREDFFMATDSVELLPCCFEAPGRRAYLRHLVVSQHYELRLVLLRVTEHDGAVQLPAGRAVAVGLPATAPVRDHRSPEHLGYRAPSRSWCSSRHVP